jgi:hypothetical protein
VLKPKGIALAGGDVEHEEVEGAGLGRDVHGCYQKGQGQSCSPGNEKYIELSELCMTMPVPVSAAGTHLRRSFDAALWADAKTPSDQGFRLKRQPASQARTDGNVDQATGRDRGHLARRSWRNGVWKDQPVKLSPVRRREGEKGIRLDLQRRLIPRSGTNNVNIAHRISFGSA